MSEIKKEKVTSIIIEMIKIAYLSLMVRLPFEVSKYEMDSTLTAIRWKSILRKFPEIAHVL